jgi:hypothetical protein
MSENTMPPPFNAQNCQKYRSKRKLAIVIKNFIYGFENLLRKAGIQKNHLRF